MLKMRQNVIYGKMTTFGKRIFRELMEIIGFSTINYIIDLERVMKV
jgi:hypothetical protein